MENTIKKKLIFILSGFVILYVIILSKAFKVQLVDNKKLIERSNKQVFRESKVFPKRGKIFDRNGNPLAINIQTYSLFTLPQDTKNKSEYKKLAKIVPEISYKSILTKIKGRKKFTWLARKIELNKKQVDKIKKLEHVYIESVPKRYYPNNEVMAQTLGFVGVDNKGLSGIEYIFDKKLRGKPRIMKYVIDNKGRVVRHKSIDVGSEARDIKLTLDKDIQAASEKFLKEAVEKYSADIGGIGVVDVKTGEILAMANYPTFDPNYISKSKAKNRKLSFITDPIEPGSVFKTFTVASALENKVVSTDTSYYCEKGTLKVEDHIIREADTDKVLEWLSVEDIIKYSSNIGTTKIAFDLTFPKLKSTLQTFNLTEKTGVPLPGESRGIFPEKSNVSPLKLSNISFGQGLATTGLQVLSAYAAIANGGIYNPPRIIKDDSENKAKRIMSEKTSSDLIKMLKAVVNDGTGTNAKLNFFEIAGKTSTSQRPDKDGGYTGYISGFIGFPVNVANPFVIYVYVDNPKGKNYYGNLVAAPVFNKLAEYILYKNKEFHRISTKKIHNKIDKIRIRQSSVKNKVFDKTKVPEFLGLDKMSAIKLADELGIQLKHTGSGVVIKQDKEAGTTINDKMIVKLMYSLPQYE